MTTLHGFPYGEVQFNKNGQVHNQDEIDALEGVLNQGVTDLLVLSHGWNNDMETARKLYDKLLKRLRQRVEADGDLGAGRKTAVLGVLWPSKKFAASELIASGAASTGAQIATEDLEQQINSLKGGFDADSADQILERLMGLAPTIEDSKRDQDEFYSLALQLLNQNALDKEISEEVPTGWAGIEGRDALDELSKPDLSATAPKGQGDAAAFGFLSGITGAAQSLLNLLTFYQMKHRAGVIGERGLHDVLLGVRAAHPAVKIHLVGHSFGARLVTAAVRGTDAAPPLEVRSLTLLQAAFSHNGFAKKNNKTEHGYYRIVINDRRVSGPTAITHTENDKAVGIAYPLASRLKPVNAAAIVGNADDPYGGMGRNGAQNTPEAKEQTLQPKGHAYTFTEGKVHNLQADGQIHDHGDVANQAVASAILSVMKT